MPQFLSLRCGLRTLLALLPLSLTAGCLEPLALKDPYFLPGSAAASAHRAEALHTVRYNRALQAARQSCPVPAPSDATTPDGPRRATATARRDSLARLCADMPPPSAAAQGGTESAYRRWVEDRMRSLPESSSTAAGAAGGS